MPCSQGGSRRPPVPGRHLSQLMDWNPCFTQTVSITQVTSSVPTSGNNTRMSPFLSPSRTVVTGGRENSGGGGPRLDAGGCGCWGFVVQPGEALTAGLVGGGRVGTVGSHLAPHSRPWEAEQMTSPLFTCALPCKVGERQPQ